MKEKKFEWSDAEQLVSEMFRDVQKQSKRWFVAFLITLVVLAVTNTYWIYAFNSYEYVSQDGGYNYYNSEVEGDVQNGAAH